MPTNDERSNMEYLVRFNQVHETFRLAELHALAVMEGIQTTILSYSPSVSFFILNLYDYLT